VKVILVHLAVRKLWTKSRIHRGNFFFSRIQMSLSWETLSNAPVRSRLSMDTTHPGRAFHAVWTQGVSKSIVVIVDLCFRAPIWFHERSLCSSGASAVWSATIFLTSFARDFSRA